MDAPAAHPRVSTKRRVSICMGESCHGPRSTVYNPPTRQRSLRSTITALIMNIIVFGASGNCGRHFVRLAAAKGHRITAVARDGSETASTPNVTVVRGNVLDASFVARAIPGHDAVMSGLGMR